MTETITREWTAYCNEDGEPWAVFINGHVDLRTIRSKACRAEMKEAFEKFAGDADDYFEHDLDIGHWWIRDTTGSEDVDDSAGGDYPWQFCSKDEAGACPITGAKFS
jgi:hypothetical protein